MKVQYKLIPLAALLLTGCAAKYTYTHTKTSDGAETCEVTITSSREVDVGSIVIGTDCGAEGGAEGMTADNLAEILKAIFTLTSQ